VHLHLDHTFERLDEKREGRLYLAKPDPAPAGLSDEHQDVSARAIVQYSDTPEELPALRIRSSIPTDAAAESQMLTQLLVSYKVNPQTLV